MKCGETVSVCCETVRNTQYINSFRTSEETHHVSGTERNRLMLFGETVLAYCADRMEHTDKIYGQNAEFSYVTAGGIRPG
jgi:hypothetical protein